MGRALGLCLSWKVLAALGAVAIAVLVFAPGAALAVLPLLLLAACPLSMAWMMFQMRGHGSQADSCHSPGPDESPEAKRARLAAIRQEEQRLEFELAATAADGAGTTPALHPTPTPAVRS